MAIEKTKNKKEINGSVRAIIILIAILTIIVGIVCLINSFASKTVPIFETKELYNYSNVFSSESNINLKENTFIKQEDIDESQTYLADLISDIVFDMKYKYVASEKSDVNYDYKIEAIVTATYLTNNKQYEVLNKSEVLKNVENQYTNQGNFEINEDIKIDYSKYHEMIKSFKQLMGINATSNLYIKFIVNTNTVIGEEVIDNEYVSNYNISIGDKIALIADYKDETIEKRITKTEQYEQAVETDIKDVCGAIVLIVCGIVLLVIVIKNTQKIDVEKNSFKIKVNKIMKLYENKIVEIEDLNQIDLKAATKVKDFVQLLKLSDEALVPIYCYINEEVEEKAYFIVTKYENNYLYILE